MSNVYVKFVQAAPDAFGRLYRFAKAISTPRIKSPVYLFNAAYARKMEQLLTDYAPDLIVCTHMFGGQSVTYLPPPRPVERLVRHGHDRLHDSSLH